MLTALGRFEEAIPYLERMPAVFVVDIASIPMFEPFRKDPRFMALIETLGMTGAYKQARADIEKAKLEDGR